MYSIIVLDNEGGGVLLWTPSGGRVLLFLCLVASSVLDPDSDPYFHPESGTESDLLLSYVYITVENFGF